MKNLCAYVSLSTNFKLLDCKCSIKIIFVFPVVTSTIPYIELAQIIIYSSELRHPPNMFTVIE